MQANVFSYDLILANIYIMQFKKELFNMLFIFLGFIVFIYVSSVITGTKGENIPSEFNNSLDVMTIISNEAFIAKQF
jgi:hypothetical protein